MAANREDQGAPPFLRPPLLSLPPSQLYGNNIYPPSREREGEEREDREEGEEERDGEELEGEEGREREERDSESDGEEELEVEEEGEEEDNQSSTPAGSDYNDTNEEPTIDFLAGLRPGILSQPAPLQLQCIMYIIGHLFTEEEEEDHLPLSSLSLLPRHLRHQLLLLLPAVDVCKLEGTPMTRDIPMDEIWKTLYRERIPHNVMKLIQETFEKKLILYSDNDTQSCNQSISHKERYFNTVFSCHDIVKSFCSCELDDYLCRSQYTTDRFEHFLPSLLYAMRSSNMPQYFIQDATLSIHNIYRCAAQYSSSLTPLRYKGHFSQFSNAIHDPISTITLKLKDVIIFKLQVTHLDISKYGSNVRFDLKTTGDSPQSVSLPITVFSYKDLIPVLEYSQELTEFKLDYDDRDKLENTATITTLIKHISSLLYRPLFSDLVLHWRGHMEPGNILLLLSNFFSTPYLVKMIIEDVNCPQLGASLESLPFNKGQEFKTLELINCTFSPNLSSLLPPVLPLEKLTLNTPDYNTVTSFTRLSSITADTMTLGNLSITSENVSEICSLFQIIKADNWNIGFEIMSENAQETIAILRSKLASVLDDIRCIVISTSHGSTILPLLELLFSSSTLPHLELGLRIDVFTKETADEIYYSWDGKGRSVPLNEIMLINHKGDPNVSSILLSMTRTLSIKDKLNLLPRNYEAYTQLLY